MIQLAKTDVENPVKSERTDFGGSFPRIRFVAILQLSRPGNCLIGFLSVLVGVFVENRQGVGQSIFLAALTAALSAALIMAGGNAFNDFCDAEIDRINKPGRPIPSGRITKKWALVGSLSFIIVGIVLSSFISSLTFLAAVVASLLLILYSLELKRSFLFGNLVVSSLSGFAFIYGGLATGIVRLSLVPALYAFLFHFGREIIKDIEDINGDSVAKADTIPIHIGIKSSLIVTVVTYLLLIALTPLPYWMGLFGWTYLVIVIVGVDLILAYVIVAAWKDHSSENLRRLSTILKIDMLVGLLALIVGNCV